MGVNLGCQLEFPWRFLNEPSLGDLKNLLGRSDTEVLGVSVRFLSRSQKKDVAQSIRWVSGQ